MTERTRQVLLLVAAAAVLGIGLVLGAVLFGGDDDGGSVATATTTTLDEGSDGSTTTSGGGEGDDGTTTTADDGDLRDLAPPTTLDTDGMSGPQRELAEAINRAFQLDYHAVYTGAFAAQDGSTTQATVEIWRQRPLARRDTTIGDAPSNGLKTQEYRLTDRILGCVLSEPVEGDGPATFQCLDSQGRGVDPADPLVGAVDAEAGPVTATDEMLGTTPIRCFRVAAPEGEQLACFDRDGIPAVMDGGDGRLERVSVDESITAADFEPPEEGGS